MRSLKSTQNKSYCTKLNISSKLQTSSIHYILNTLICMTNKNQIPIFMQTANKELVRTSINHSSLSHKSQALVLWNSSQLKASRLTKSSKYNMVQQITIIVANIVNHTFTEFWHDKNLEWSSRRQHKDL